jgi:hypothetical protein
VEKHMGDKLGNVPAPQAPPGGACVACGAAVVSLGIGRFRIGGTPGGAKLIFGELAELGEETIALELLACRQCWRVEFRLPRET